MLLATSRDAVSLELLPDDVLIRIIYFVPPTENLSVLQLLSHRFHTLAGNQLLWKGHCLKTFRYWHPRHYLKDKLQLRTSEVDWRALFIKRKTQNDKIAELLELIIQTRQSRVARIGQICKFGYDAKDYLLSQIKSDETICDFLARRQFSQDALSSIHRSVAIAEWQRVRDRQRGNGSNSRLLERSLTAFDMFVLYDDVGDIDEMSTLLDELAAKFLSRQPNWQTMTTRDKALRLNNWLRQRNLTGITVGDFSNLRNSLLGQALRHPEHESNPNISSSIFCALAERVGINAQCFLAPMMVHVIVTPPDGESLDGTADTTQSYMFLDPWGSEGEAPLRHLEELTSRFGLNIRDLIGAGTPGGVTERASNNIEVCCVRNLRTSTSRNVARLIKGNDIVNLHSCLYAVKWARALFAQPYTLLWNQRVSDLLRFAIQHWPEDSWVIREYAGQLPPIDVLQPALGQLEAFHKDVMTADSISPTVYANPLPASRVTPFRIGQVFRHRRFNWIGAITGFYAIEPPSWEQFDAEGEVTAMTSDEEVKGRFYVKCLRMDGIEQPVVAPANICILTDAETIDEDRFPTAGKFFKRFNEDTCEFVSNLQEEYPNL